VRNIPRQRRYVSPTALTLCRPLLSFDLPRDAYVLRAVGRRFGPVLRQDRRGQRTAEFAGPERRRGARRTERDRGRVAA
jgi:hypothetical protein